MIDNPRCWTSETRKARKEHKCCECRGVIPKGEVYEYFSGVWDDPASFKTCKDCDSLRTDIHKALKFDEVPEFGYLYESVFAAEQIDFIERYLESKQKRGGKIETWMLTIRDRLRSVDADKPPQTEGAPCATPVFPKEAMTTPTEPENPPAYNPADFHHWKCECGAMADGNCRWNGRAYEHHHGYPIGHVLMKNITEAAKPKYERPIPDPLFPCGIEGCSDERTWPAHSLHWSQKAAKWICLECWDSEIHGEHRPAVSLESELKARAAK